MRSVRNLILILVILTSTLSESRARTADDPSFNGQTMSAWVAMLKEDPLPRKRRAAAIALGQIVIDFPSTHPTVLPALARAVRNDSSPAVRLQAAILLGQQPAERSEHFFVDTLEALRIEKDSDVRRELAITLGRLDRLAFPATRALGELLKDPAPATRASAAEALGRIGPDATTVSPQLLPLLKDPNRNVRQAAMFALGRVDPDDRDSASKAVLTCLQSERASTRTLWGQAAVGSSLCWASQRDAQLIMTAISTLGLLRQQSDEVLQVLSESMRDPSAEIRMRAALAIGKLGSAAQKAEDTLIEALQNDPDKQVRLVALRTYCWAFSENSSRIIPILASRVPKDPDYEVRVAIIEEIAATGEAAKKVLPVLREAQRDPQLRVREAARQAIRQVEIPADPSKP